MARTRPHVKVHLSVADHPKTTAAWGDLAMRGMLVELWRKAGEKYAARRDDWVPLRPTDRMEIACETELSRADVAVKSLCQQMGYAVKRYANRWEVRVRKFAKKQGYEDKELHTFPSELREELQPPNPNPNPNPKQIQNPNTEQEARPAAEPKPASAPPLTLDPSPAPRARRARSAKPIDPRVQAAWPAIRAAFAEHGTNLGDSVGVDRSELIAKRIDEGATADDLVRAVHGYVRINGLAKRPDGFDPGAFFRPKTVFKLDGFSDRVDAGAGPRPVGSTISKAERMWGSR